MPGRKQTPEVRRDPVGSGTGRNETVPSRSVCLAGSRNSKATSEERRSEKNQGPSHPEKDLAFSLGRREATGGSAQSSDLV